MKKYRGNSSDPYWNFVVISSTHLKVTTEIFTYIEQAQQKKFIE